jgi:deoxyribodipyrimidine photo-lyase
MPASIDQRRIRTLREGEYESGPIVYWMSRDQRAADNWALLYAQQLAIENGTHLAVVFCLVPEYLEATIRQYGFMMHGLREVEKNLAAKNIPFFLLLGNPGDTLPAFLKQYKVGALVTDFNPLRINRKWKSDVGNQTDIPFYEVDAHNIVPVWEVSNKQEYAANFFRRKLNPKLSEFLTEFPLLKKQKSEWPRRVSPIDWNKARNSLKVNMDIAELDWIKPGHKAGMKQFDEFMKKHFRQYSSKRNDPTVDFQSGLSPYLHFGQISAQRIVLETLKRSPRSNPQESFFNELIIWRELADNYCYYNADYDRVKGFPDWAQKTLDEHRNDFREYLYTADEFENAKTHDDLWNAAQMEMVRTGKMHGYMRMYWAKKILEWTVASEQALDFAIYLNDKYSLDGRDPNGYAGIAWSIGGVHDRPWFEREIFGKIRFMSYNGCKNKFNVAKYIEKINKL